MLDQVPMKNSAEDEAVKDATYRVAASEVRQIVEQIERCEAEKAAIADDIKAFYASAKARGYDVKVLRKVIALRKRDADDVAEEQAVLDLYKDALGMG